MGFDVPSNPSYDSMILLPVCCEDRGDQEIRRAAQRRWRFYKGAPQSSWASVTTREGESLTGNNSSKDTATLWKCSFHPKGQFPTLPDPWASSCRRDSSIHVSKNDSNSASHLPWTSSPCFAELSSLSTGTALFCTGPSPLLGWKSQKEE